ncbi:hypothetical protein MPRI_38460 [Mycobacterium paraintracellulare]|uniref:Secreted protein n=1 Tax=Mycobacterium paraintracellulare TaxID=1138383 RepID=A0ABM7K9X2_9MYCO|nr:hypothetical protein MPRI_38460 [Mycobacterium paraintracellulare]BCO41103.1 hypothetical protein MINTM001_22420 [Mycobacterium paraintracellulare]BCO88773.1 hypothetical protein MINTM015_20300 [Mycobacterium paraintracellulare]
MAKLSGADSGGLVVGPVALWLPSVTRTPTTAKTPTSTTAAMPIAIKRPREMCRNRLDVGTLALPLTTTRLRTSFWSGVATRDGFSG